MGDLRAAVAIQAFGPHAREQLVRRAVQARCVVRNVQQTLGEKPTPEELARRVAAAPVRDIAGDPACMRLVAKGVYVSLTSSPARLGNVHQVLDSLNLDHVRGIVVALPERFRDAEPYTIPEALERYGNSRGWTGDVVIIHGGEDLGPIHKMVPAIEHVQRESPGGVVISIDDDALYRPGMVNEMIRALAHARDPEKTVVAGSVLRSSHWRIKRSRWRGLVVEGYGGIAYPVQAIDTALMRRGAGLGKPTRMSDDMVISYVLARSGLNVQQVANRYFNVSQVALLDYGFGADALHKMALSGDGFSRGGLTDRAAALRHTLQGILDTSPSRDHAKNYQLAVDMLIEGL